MQVIEALSYSPPPPFGGQGWRKGGLHVRETFSLQIFSGNFDFRPEKFGRANFRPDFFWDFQISNRKKAGRKNFSPKFFTFFNIRPEKFPVFKISRPKKVRVFRSRCRIRITGFTPEK
jgi:hypothetical protein